MIFSISGTPLNIKDKQHLNNFSSYLFSTSQNHKSNKDTDHNNYHYVVDGVSKYGLNTEPSKNKRDFSDAIDNKKITARQLKMNIHYIAFAFKYNNKLISNIFKKDKDGNIELIIDEETFNLIVSNNFGGDPDKFGDAADEILAGVDVFYFFDDVKPDLKDAVTKKILKNFINDKTLIAITHIDQKDMYHIHTIEFKK